MPVFLALILSIAIGYFLGSLVFVLFGALIIALPLYVIVKFFISTHLIPCLEKRKERRKIRKILKERLKYLV